MGHKIKSILKSTIALALAIVLCVELIPGMPKVQAATEFDSDKAPKAVLLVEDSNDPSGYRQLVEGETITSLNTGFFLRWSWGEKNIATLGLDTGVEYQLPNTPLSNIAIETLGENIPVSNEDGVFATINATNMTVTFSRVNNVGIPWMGLECKLSDDAVPEDANGKVTIKIPGNKEVTINVTDPDFLPKGPSVDKEKGTFNPGDGTVTWTVTYTEPEKFYANTPQNFVDTIPTGMEFVSFDANSTGITCNATAKGTGAITFTIPDTMKNKDNWTSNPVQYTFSYVTKLTDAEKVKILNGTAASYPNNIVLNGTKPDDSPIQIVTDIDTVSIPANTYPAVSKSGGSYSGGKVTWTITVNTLGLGTTGYTLTDTMGSGLTIDGVVSIEDKDGTHTVSPTVTNQVFTVDLSGYTAKADGTLKLTYTTAVAASVFDEDATVPDSVKNSASLTAAITAGTISKAANGIGPASFSTEMIRKRPNDFSFTDSSINAGEAWFGYDVTINPNALSGIQPAEFVELLDYKKDNTQTDKTILAVPRQSCIMGSRADIISIFTSKGLTVDASTFRWLDGNKSEYPDDNDIAPENRKGIKITITDGLDGASKTLNFKEKVWDPNILLKPHGNSGDDALYNVATIKPAAGSVQAADTTWGYTHKPIDILRKESSSYDASTRTMTWKLTINKARGTAPGNFTIVDTLDSKSEYIAGSSVFEGTALIAGEGADDSNKVVYDKNSKKLTFTLSATANKENGFELTYQTKVIVPDNNSLMENDLVLNNQAQITFTDKNVTQDANCTVTLPGKTVLDKKGGIVKENNKETNKLKYTVKINPYTLTLDDETTNLFLEDKLGDGIVLDENSLVLKEGISSTSAGDLLFNKQSTTEINFSNSYTVDVADAGKPPISIIFGQDGHTYDYPNNTFRIKLPENAINTPYILEYSAVATKPGALNNTISIEGASIPTASSGSLETVTFSAKAYGGATKYVPSAGGYNINVTKRDKDTNDPVTFTGESETQRGAEFELFVGTNTRVATAVSSDDNGVAQFYIPQSFLNTLADTDKLYIREVTPPQGYLISNALIQITVADLKQNGTATAMEKDFVDSRTEELDKNPGDPELTPGKESVTVLKQWANDTEGDRPESVSVQLYDTTTGSKVVEGGPAELTAAGGWSYVWSGLDPGKTWEVEEVGTTTGYTPTYTKNDTNGLDWTITNTKDSPAPVTDTVTVKKEWVGDTTAIRPTSITVELYEVTNPNAPDSQETKRDTVTLSAQDNWTYIWDGLETDKNWRVKEIVPNGYEISSIKVDGVSANTTAVGKIWEITNTKTSPADNSGIIPSTPTTTPTHKVEFVTPIGPKPSDQEGFTGTTPATNPTTVLKPGDEVDGNIFEGWYEDPEFTKPFDFTKPITEDKKAYAKWKEKEKEGTGTEEKPDGEKPDGEKPEDTTDTEEPTKPEDPAKPSDPTKPADPTKPTDTTTPAPNNTPAKEPVKVTFKTEIGVTPEMQTLTPGTTAVDPKAPMDPTSLKPGTVINGYRFAGWYLDPEFKIPFDFSTAISEDTVLYAKWVAVGSSSPKTGVEDYYGFAALLVAMLIILGFVSLKPRKRDRFS